MENKIRHVGTIESVDAGCVKVRVTQSSACSSCQAASQCQASESKEKVVDVYTDAAQYRVGQVVSVVASYSTGMFAVTVAMIIPMVIMLVTMVGCGMAGLSEMTCAAVSLATLIPYYCILYMLRHQINRRVAFSIETP